MRSLKFFILAIIFYPSIVYSEINYQRINKNFVEPKLFLKELNFEVQASKKIVIKGVHINNSKESYDFLFDTGCKKSYISQELASSLKIKTTGSALSDDGTKLVQHSVGIIDINVNNIEFKNIEVLIDNEKNKSSEVFKVDGIIGMNMIRLCVWKINLLENSIIITNDIHNFENIDQYYKQKVKFILGVPFISGGFNNGLYKGDMLLDLGDNVTFSMKNNRFNKFLIRNNIPTIRSYGYAMESSYSKSISIDTSDYIRLSQFNSFNFGKATRHKFENTDKIIHQPIVFISEQLVNLVIGAGILDRYSLILDFPKKKFYSKVIQQTLDYKSFGMDIMPNNKSFTVAIIWANSSAFNSGLKAGDAVIKIDTLGLINYTSPTHKIYKTIKEILNNNDEIEITTKRNNKIVKHKLQKTNLFLDN